MDLGVQNLSLSPAQLRQGKQQQRVERETDGELREGGWCQGEGEGEGVRGAAEEGKNRPPRCWSLLLLLPAGLGLVTPKAQVPKEKKLLEARPVPFANGGRAW